MVSERNLKRKGYLKRNNRKKQSNKLNLNSLQNLNPHQKPKTVAKTTAPMKKRMKPMRGPMVEAKQTSKPMAGNRRTDVSAQPTAGRMTAADMFERRKKEKNKAMIRKMKPLRIQ